MPIITIIIGVLLSATGILGFISTGSQHPTALIPLVVGTLFEMMGALALKPTMRKHAMHAAAMVGVLGFLAAGGRLIVAMLKGTLPSGMALFSLLSMAILCGLFVVLCVNSFIQASRNRQASQGLPLDPSSSTRA